jgi:hypothetical protein
VRLVTAAFLLLLALPASARASFSVSSPTLTRAPVVTIESDPGDVVTCRVLPAPDFTPCDPTWQPPVAEDRDYTIEVQDDHYPVIFRRTFALDRTPPVIAFTAGPADYSFVATDAHPGTLDCALDGAVAPCAATVTVPGDHTLVAHAVDAAGNESTVTRTLTLAQPQVTHVDPKPEGGVLSTTASSPSAKLTSTHTRRWTRLRTLTLRDVEIGTAIKATCTGKGCPKRALRLTATKKSVSLAGLTGRKLTPGTVIKITLSAKGKVTRTFTITIRATRAPQVS